MPGFETPQNPQGPGGEPELNLLLHNQTLDEPLWKSLVRNIDEFFFPKKLPPLVLTSKPVPVRDIWGFYNYKGRGAAGSTALHLLALALIILATYLGRRIVDVVKPKQTVELIMPDDLPVLPASKNQSGGGGGGGDRDKLQASQGRLPKQSMQQFTPPLAVVRNTDPKLPMAPTIVVRCRICLPCLRTGRARAAALVLAVAAAWALAKVPALVPATVVAPVAECSGWAEGFRLPKRFTLPSLNIPRKLGRSSRWAWWCCGWW